jgi:hypothetical protein
MPNEKASKSNYKKIILLMDNTMSFLFTFVSLYITIKNNMERSQVNGKLIKTIWMKHKKKN